MSRTIRNSRQVAVLLAAACALLILAEAPAAGFLTIRLSGNLVGQEGNGDSGGSGEKESVTDDGALVAYVSEATNLEIPDPIGGGGGAEGVPLPDSNGASDIFVASVLTGGNVRVSTDVTGREGNGPSRNPAISAGGRYVALESDATDLVAADFNLATDVFRKDVLTGEVLLVSVHQAGYQGFGPSRNPSISADGRYVAFESDAKLAANDDDNMITDIYVRDLATRRTILLSANQFGIPGNDKSVNASISASGDVVAFESRATNLVFGDANGASDIFLRTILPPSLEIVSLSSMGLQANGDSGAPSISADGNAISFESNASNLDIVLPDTNGQTDVFLRYRTTGTTLRVSVDDTRQGDGPSTGSAISGEGTRVAFVSEAETFGAPTNGLPDVFIKNLVTGVLMLVSSGHGGQVADGPSYRPAISADAHTVAFSSDATNLVDGDSGLHTDAFAWRDEETCPSGAVENGVVSGPLHGTVEPASGPADPIVHTVSCMAADLGL